MALTWLLLLGSGETTSYSRWVGSQKVRFDEGAGKVSQLRIQSWGRLSVIFLVFGLNGFLNFIPLPPPGGNAGQFRRYIVMEVAVYPKSGHEVEIRSLDFILQSESGGTASA